MRNKSCISVKQNLDVKQLIRIEHNYKKSIMLAKHFDKSLYKQLNLINDESYWFNFEDDVNYKDLISAQAI